MSAPTSNQESNSCHTPMAFEPTCEFEREVYQKWLAGQPSLQQNVTPGWQVYNGRRNQHHGPANATISRIDSGVDVWGDQCPRSQKGPQPQLEPDMSQHQNNSETEQELSSHTECPIPEACELSPEMSSTMRHFSVRHNCLYAEAKKQLVDKIVHKVMDNAAPRIMALLEEELERRAAEKDEEDDEESRRTTMDTEVSPKV